MSIDKQKLSILSLPAAVAANMLIAYTLMMLCRIIFVWINIDFYPDLTLSHFLQMAGGGLMFDTSALLYGNALYLLLVLLPCHIKENRRYHNALRWLFVVVNMLYVAINLIDSVYFRFSGRRTTMSVFSQFSNESNLGSIIAQEALSHWYLVLIAIFLGWAVFRLYRFPKPEWKGNKVAYYIVSTLVLAIVAPFIVFGMRGGIGRDVRPITISNANTYVNKPIETAIVLNTPFSMLRTIGKKPFVTPSYFPNEESLAAIYTPLHLPGDSIKPNRKNVVVLVLESFGKEYIGALNKHLDGGKYRGYTPFLDSLIEESLVFDYSFANGQQSIDGLPSVLSGIPRFVEPFFLTPASLNKLQGLGSVLRDEGYYTAFFHGARNGSMGFQAYSRSVGYTDYFGREDYGNEADFDGFWAIWDEEFMQYFGRKIGTFPQPFSVGLFTASSHHPFNVPERYKGKFPEGSLPIHKCIGYSDNALRLFFEYARQQKWYENTIFVLVADHTNLAEHPEYLTDAGRWAVPVIFYTPDGSLKGHRSGIAQQIDIMPTVLGYLGYDKPFISFGCNLLDTPDEDTWAINYNNGIYQYFKGDYMLQFDGEKTVAVYAFKSDRLLEHNLAGTVECQYEMETMVKAIIQQYMSRMNSDMLTPQ